MNFDADKILKALQTNPAAVFEQVKQASGALVEKVRTDPDAQKLAMGVGAGALAGMFAGKVAPRLTGGVLKIGALAALGGLAYKAYQGYQAKQAGNPEGAAASPDTDDLAPAPAGLGFGPSDQSEESRAAYGRAMLTAMIAAAKADGQLDQTEKGRLFDRLMQIELSDEEKDFLFDEMAKPQDMQRVVALASSPAMAAELYAASLLAIEVDSQVERAYLNDLAAALRLDPALVAELHAKA
jgi:uncharacterized membrane protein YebE (DUF533 family)